MLIRASVEFWMGTTMRIVMLTALASALVLCAAGKCADAHVAPLADTAKPADAAQLEASGGLEGIELQPERLAAGAEIGRCPDQRSVEMKGRERHGRISREERQGHPSSPFAGAGATLPAIARRAGKRTDSPVLSLEMPISGV